MVVPATPTFALLFAASMGITWLSTMPLTTALVAQMFGDRYLATLGGMVFCSHQVGSFLGVWLGGRAYDQFGSYQVVWWTAAFLSFGSAILHYALDDRPVTFSRQVANLEN